VADLFLAHTPYHVLLAIGAARPGSTLVVVTDFASSDLLLDSVRDCSDSPFTHVRVIPGGNGRTAVGQVWRRARNAWQLRLTDLPAVDRVLVSNDYLPEDQALLNRVASRWPNAVRCYLEDGAAAYSGNGFGFGTEWWRTAFRKACFGPWYRYVNVMGTHPLLQRALLLFPEHARPELQRLPRDAYGADSFHQPHVRTFIDHYWERWTRLYGEVPEVETLLLVAHHELAMRLPDYAKAFRGVCAKAAEKGQRVGVKYHPRETQPDPLRLTELPGVAVLPRALAAEFLFVRQGKRLRLLVGDITTALMSARLLAPDARVVSLAPMLGVKDKPLLNVFRALGIVVGDQFNSTASSQWA